jgi:hypothetical protein
MIFMQRCQILMSIFVLLGAVSNQRADDIPKRLNFDRYSAMLNRSPFAVATAVALPAATPNFAKDLYVSSAAKSPEGDIITIISSSDKTFRKYLTTKEPVDGYSIANIEWSDRVGETKATISKDGQFATLTFNQALVTQTVSAAPPNLMPPTAPPVMAPGTVPKPIPPMPNQAPHVRGTISRNPIGAPTPNPLPTPEP